VDMGTEAEVVDMVDGTTVRETLRTEMVRMVAAGGMATAAHLEDVEITVEEDLPMGWVLRDRHTRTRLWVIMDGEDTAHFNRVRRMAEIQPPRTTETGLLHTVATAAAAAGVVVRLGEDTVHKAETVMVVLMVVVEGMDMGVEMGAEGAATVMAGTVVVAAVVVVMAGTAEVEMEMEMARPGMEVMEETAPPAEGMEGTVKVLKVTLEADEVEAETNRVLPTEVVAEGTDAIDSSSYCFSSL